jgi:hypothetical protein
MRRTIGAFLALSLCWLVPGAAAASGRPQPPGHPATPKPMRHIERFAPLQAESFCRKHVEPGVKAFERLTLATYQDSHSDGDIRPCESGTSEHYDGRAWDWGVDHRSKHGRADGKAMLNWLFATDADGNHAAMFRRLGLMYVIWNKRIWGTWDKRWAPYHCSGANACHVTHIHFSFGWAGAEKQTSYWTHKVSPVRPPDYPVFTGRHGHRAVVVAARVGSAKPVWQLKGGARYAVTARGVWHHSKARHGLADARCTWTHQGWKPTPGGGARVELSRPSVAVARWVPVHDSGNGCDPTAHAYTLKVAPHQTSAVTIQLPDGKRSNDSGSVSFRFDGA